MVISILANKKMKKLYDVNREFKVCGKNGLLIKHKVDICEFGGLSGYSSMCGTSL